MRAVRQLADSLALLENELSSFPADGQKNFDQVAGHPAHKRKAIAEIRESLVRFLGSNNEAF